MAVMLDTSRALRTPEDRLVLVRAIVAALPEDELDWIEWKIAGDGGPNDEAIEGHPLHGRGLAAYRAHKVINSAWIEERIRVNSVHPLHSEARFRELHHYVLLLRRDA